MVNEEQSRWLTFFMLVVILVLFPAAIQTAIALGIIGWYGILGIAAIGIIVFLLYHPELLFWLIAIVFGFVAIVWSMVRLETRWPGGLERIGYGLTSVFGAGLGLIVIIDSINRGKNIGDASIMALICFVGAIAAAWRCSRAKPINTSQWLRR